MWMDPDWSMRLWAGRHTESGFFLKEKKKNKARKRGTDDDGKVQMVDGQTETRRSQSIFTPSPSTFPFHQDQLAKDASAKGGRPN